MFPVIINKMDGLSPRRVTLLPLEFDAFAQGVPACAINPTSGEIKFDQPGHAFWGPFQIMQVGLENVARQRIENPFPRFLDYRKAGKLAIEHEVSDLKDAHLQGRAIELAVRTLIINPETDKIELRRLRKGVILPTRRGRALL